MNIWWTQTIKWSHSAAMWCSLLSTWLVLFEGNYMLLRILLNAPWNISLINMIAITKDHTYPVAFCSWSSCGPPLHHPKPSSCTHQIPGIITTKCILFTRTVGYILILIVQHTCLLHFNITLLCLVWILWYSPHVLAPIYCTICLLFTWTSNSAH